jgi:hypothetical protein
MNLGQIGTGITGILGSIFGNNSNQNLSNTLQGMYAPAAQAAQGPMQQLSSTLTNPSSYFNSPMYTSMANLYGNGVQAGKNAGGTTGNNIDYTQKMMGFGANSYDNYVNSLSGGTNALMSNARGMAPYGAYGASLGHQSAGGMFGGIASGLGSLYSGLGGASGIGSILGF